MANDVQRVGAFDHARPETVVEGKAARVPGIGKVEIPSVETGGVHDFGERQVVSGN
jgi:hypothetical protein